jgi:hypothetical protein
LGIFMALLIIVFIADRIRQHNEDFKEAERIKKLKKQRQHERFIESERRRNEIRKEDDSAYAHWFVPSNRKGRR